MKACEDCAQSPCVCKPKSISDSSSRSIVSPTTKVRWYLCEWSRGCNMPVRTNPDKGAGADTLCRWHKECSRNDGDKAMPSDPQRCAAWLEGMQKEYPSTGFWSLPFHRLWPILTGQKPLFTPTPIEPRPMKTVVLLLALVLLAGCAVSVGGRTTATQRVDRSFWQDGKLWSCYVTDEVYGHTTSAYARKGICFELVH